MKLQIIKLITLIAFLTSVGFSSSAQNDGFDLSSTNDSFSSSTAFAIDKNIISFEVANLVDKKIFEHAPYPNYGGIEGLWSPHIWTITLFLAEGTDVTSLAPIITLAPGAIITSQHEDVLDFSQQVEYTVIGADGSTVTYLFTAYVQDNTRTWGWLIIDKYPSSAGYTFPSGMHYYDEQTKFQCTAYENQGYKFKQWLVNDSPAGNDTYFNNYIPLNYGYSYLTAEFEEIQPVYHLVSIGSANYYQGDVFPWGPNYVLDGYSISVNALPEEGNAFKQWTLNGSQTIYPASFNFKPSSDSYLTAFFVTQHTVTVQSEDTNKGTAALFFGGNVAYVNDGDFVLVIANPKPGYVFEGWYENGFMRKSGLPMYDFQPFSTCILEAKFIEQYTVTLKSEDTSKGTVSGGGTCDAGKSVPISATPKSGYVFEGWYLYGSKISGVASFSYQPSASCTLTAKFDIAGSITGSNVVCYEGSQFVYSPSPAVGSITWTLTAGSPFSFNPPDQPALMQKTTSSAPHQVVVYRTSAGSSSGTLTATNSSGVSTTKAISPCSLSINGSSTVCYNGDQHTLNYPPPSGATLYYWTVTGPFSFSSSSVVTSTTTYPPIVYKTTASNSTGTISAHIGSVSGTVVASKTLYPCTSTISGPSSLCYNSGNFTLNGAPSGTVIYWTVDNSSYSVTSSGNPTTVTYTGPYTLGPINLYAHTGSTSGPVIATAFISYCYPTISGPSEVCYGGSSFTLQNAPPETIYWTLDDPTVFTVNPTGNPTFVTRIGQSSSNSKLRARVGGPSGLIMTDVVIYPCLVTDITGNGNICNSSSAVFSINTGQYATWSVTSGFSLSTNYGVSTTVSATTPNQYGTLTAVVGATTYTKSIQSLAPPGCYFPKTDYVYMSGLPGGASVQLNPYPSDTDPYAIYKWDVLFEENVWYDVQSGSDSHSLNVVYDLTLPSSLRVDAYQYISPYGYSPLPTVEYRTATINYRSLGINVYPNPVAAVLNIEISDEAIAKAKAFVPTATKGKSQDLTFDIRLFDVLGNMVRQQSSKGGTVQLNVTNLPNGVYFLSIYDGVSEKPEMKRVIVNH